MLPDSALHGFKVMFATPCYISAVTMPYVMSLVGLVGHCHRFGLKHNVFMHSQSLVTRARNRCVAEFLHDESLTHLFFIDSDIEFTPQAVMRLVLSDKDVISGVYPLKQLNWPEGGAPAGATQRFLEDRFNNYPVNAPDYTNANIAATLDADGFAEVWDAPTGFMCIKRQVFTELIKGYPHYNYAPDGPPPRLPQEYY